MTRHPVPFAHAGLIDFSKRSGSSCEAAIGCRSATDEQRDHRFALESVFCQQLRVCGDVQSGTD